ncbi:uncharacterized protein HD556DRAFT_1310159 [Suillus plorans]|uniref:Uncharacterized protein n=1 Tax=Suillus plorans TaxID=116603 RepID=A0A9P7AK46_9AGAM|nr:uncharacterized protein HD556DRAFT_1310159 [Suillus plorans]KAG1791055.1 hypothetical protein HD556DRAFT_1310159 [Suillus plorans]
MYRIKSYTFNLHEELHQNAIVVIIVIPTGAIVAYCKMMLDGIELEDDEQDSLFTKFSIDTVYSSYLASRYRVRQYTHLLMLLKHEEEAWAQRVKSASRLMPEYVPPMVWST